MERERESRERDNIVAVAMLYTTSFPGRYRQQAGCAGSSGPWEPTTLIYTRREQTSPANIHAGNEAVDGGNVAAPVRMERDREIHVSVTAWPQWLLYLQLAFPADIGNEPAVPARPALESRQRYYRREQASSANIHAGNEAVDGGNMAAHVWSVTVRFTWAWQHGRSGYYIYN